MARRRNGNRLHAVAGLPGVELLEADFSGQPFGRHAHDAFAIGAIDDGVGGYDCRGARHALPRHTLSLMNPEEPHTGYAVSERLRYKMLYVTEGALRRWLDVKAVRGFRELTPADDGRAVSAGLARVHGTLTGPKAPGWRLALEEEVLGLISEVFSRHAGLRERRAGREKEAVRRTREYITQVAHEARKDGPAADGGLSLAVLAGRVGFHSNYLLQCFTEQVGISPYAFWLVRRIEAAKGLLAEGARPVDVAYQLGFYDHAHFIRTFKKVTGVTPGGFVVHGR
ncbi:helix-turn-helix domain-containing protein [Caenispirillum salinarum]|uniref:helix-turn-helix domain-containing protein n=1 Tax=Caenispirillum salinarum TaxID=859058 RepID=UPI003850A56A